MLPYVTSDQHGAALGIIGDIREEWQRALALTDFAHQVPEAVRIPSEYLTVASTFRRLTWWAAVHRAALPMLPDDQRPTLVNFLVEQLNQQGGEGDAMAIAGLWDELVPYLGPCGPRIALDAAATIQDPWGRDYLMNLLVRVLDEAEAIAIAASIGAPHWKAEALVALAGRGISPRGHPAFLAAAAQLGADAELAPVAALLPDHQRRAVLDAATLKFMDQTHIGEPTSVVTDYVATSSSGQLWLLWREGTQRLASQRRDEIFAIMGGLVLLARRLAGERVVADIVAAIWDVVRWWP
jgi:hypothetical protein